MVSSVGMIPIETPIHPVTNRSANDGAVIDLETMDFEPTTPEEDNFALGVVEFSGNVVLAYRAAYGTEVQFPLAQGRKLLSKPQIALRIKEIHGAIHENALFSLGGHMHELADIRDLAKMSGNLKTALGAERTRGEVMGLYKNHEDKNPQVAIQVNFVSQHDASV